MVNRGLKSKKKKKDYVKNGLNMAPSGKTWETRGWHGAPYLDRPAQLIRAGLLIKLMNTFIVKHAFIKHSFILSNYNTQQA